MDNCQRRGMVWQGAISMPFRQLTGLTSQIILATLLAGGAANAQGAVTPSSATSSLTFVQQRGGHLGLRTALAALDRQREYIRN